MNLKPMGLAALAGWLAAAASVGAGNTCTWTGNWDTLPANTDDVIVVSSGGNLTWSNTFPQQVASWTQAAGYSGTATFTTIYGASGFTNFTIAGDATIAGGAWTHIANVGSETYRLSVTVYGNLLITNATVNADSCGYQGTQGPSPGVYTTGASHGGEGCNRSTPGIYGSIRAPTTLGSGGARYAFVAGGGAIRLTVAGTTTVAAGGLVSANGVRENGAGAGGSIWLTTGRLEGNGTIQANGAQAINGGGGGGGRVAILLTGASADFSSWSGKNTAYGGGVSYVGAAGTVYRQTASGVSTLIVDNNGQGVVGRPTTLLVDTDVAGFSNVVITGMGILGVADTTTLDFNTFTPTLSGAANSVIAIVGDANVTYPNDWTINNCTLFAHGIGKSLSNVAIAAGGVLDQYASGTGLAFSVGGNLTVSGKINADGRGYGTGQGPGKGSPVSNGAGGVHGGTSRAPDNSLNANTYGSVLQPVTLGSGAKSAGGGAIRLTVGGTTTVAAGGLVSAIGAQENSAGSGGSVWLTTGRLEGSGTIQANGGYGYNGGGAGGGGRVAILLTAAGADFSAWSGTNSAYGGLGAGSSPPAAAGTVYLAAAGTPADGGTVTADNRNTATNITFTSLPAFTNSTENLTRTLWTAQNKGKIGLVANASIWKLTLNANSYLELAGCALTLRELTITNHYYRPGIYSAAQLAPLVSDSSGGNGRVIVRGFSTVFVIR